MVEKIIKWAEKNRFSESVIETDAIFFMIAKQFPNVTLRTVCAAVEQIREEMRR